MTNYMISISDARGTAIAVAHTTFISDAVLIAKQFKYGAVDIIDFNTGEVLVTWYHNKIMFSIFESEIIE